MHIRCCVAAFYCRLTECWVVFQILLMHHGLIHTHPKALIALGKPHVATATTDYRQRRRWVCVILETASPHIEKLGQVKGSNHITRRHCTYSSCLYSFWGKYQQKKKLSVLKLLYLYYSQYTFSVCSSTYYMDFVNRLHVCPVDENKSLDNVAVVEQPIRATVTTLSDAN